MHVGLAIYGDLAAVSGGNLYDLKLVETLRRASDRVEILSLPRSRYALHLTHNLSRLRLASWRRAPFTVLLQDELAHPSLFWLNRRLARRVAYPLVGIVHHLRSSEARPMWQRRLYAKVERAYLNTLHAFVFNSDATRAAVEGLLRRPCHGLVARPGKDRLGPAVNPSRFTEHGHYGGALRVLFVGNVIRRKGLHDLIAALKRVADEAWHLDVVGSPVPAPAYYERLQRQVIETALRNRITFHGSLSDAALAERFQASHLLAVPSSYEGFGMVYLEAMGYGLPAVATALGGAPELIRHGENGFLVAPGDIDAVAGYVRALGRNRDLLARMSLAARSTHEQWPSWEETTERMRSFLLRVVAGHEVERSRRSLKGHGE